MCKYYLGIDGGGTKTAFTVIDDESHVVYEKMAGPSSIDTVDYLVTKATIITALNDIKYPLTGIFAGIGGVISEEDKNEIEDILATSKTLINPKMVKADNDVINALYGSLNGEDGIVIIAGTGSVAYGKKAGKTFRSGGYGYQEGDLGSAYDLGHKALQHLGKVLDKREKMSMLAQNLMKAIEVYDTISFTKYVVSSSRTMVASLAKIVTSTNDLVSKRIIIKATKEVALMVKAVFKTLKFDSKVKYSIIGSLGNADGIYKENLLKNINKISPNLEYTPKINEATLGSALVAKSLF